MTTRRVKTDAERAADELAIYEKRLDRARAAAERARAAYDEAHAEYEAVLAVRNHLRAHPALPPREPDDVDVSLGEHPGLLDDDVPPHAYAMPSGVSDGRCAVEGCGAAEDDRVHVAAGVGG